MKSLGLEIDASGLLGGIRSNRFVVLVEDGVVMKVIVEKEVTDVSATAAETVLAGL